MSTESERPPRHPVPPGGREAPVVVHLAPPSLFARLRGWLLYAILAASILANISMFIAYQEYFALNEGPDEKYHSGEKFAPGKLAIIRVSGMLAPPMTGRLLKTIEKAAKDESVKGVLLRVDSPGGFVSDSHQVYHAARKLTDEHKKPVFVSMGGIAASGGYYVAMAAGPQGKLYAEPTTWTGSIGVIIHRYEAIELAEKVGIRSVPIKTGEFKDTLSPFRELTEREQALWDDILKQSLDQFLEVIDDGRGNLDLAQIRELATGQVFTAKDAKANGLIDEIGYEEDALKELQKACGLTEARVVTYQYPISLSELLMGAASVPDPMSCWREWLESTAPRAMYFCSWGLPVLLAPGAAH